MIAVELELNVVEVPPESCVVWETDDDTDDLDDVDGMLLELGDVAYVVIAGRLLVGRTCEHFVSLTLASPVVMLQLVTS